MRGQVLVLLDHTVFPPIAAGGVHFFSRLSDRALIGGSVLILLLEMGFPMLKTRAYFFQRALRPGAY